MRTCWGRIMNQQLINMDAIKIFKNRLDKLGIKTEFIGNYPWIYLYKINGITVKEKYMSEYGYTMAFSPIRTGESTKFTDLSMLFELIRKYL